MINRIQIRNFKSLKQVDLKLGGLNLFIGTNSSGKSNFLDALRVLQGIGNGYTVSEILNGKPRTSTSELWDGIRGGAEYATFRAAGEDQEPTRDITFEIAGRARSTEVFNFEYHISFAAKSGRITREWLSAGAQDIFDSHKYENNPDSLIIGVAYSKGQRGKQPKGQFERSRPVIHQFAEFQNARASDRRIASACINALANVQRLDPSPDILRGYSAAQRVARMGEHGENFAALVNAIIGNQQDKSAYLEWLRELSPADVDDVLILEGALREPLFAVKEAGKIFPAPVLSDGTLRFSAIAAAFFQQSVPAVLTLEEIEKGINPTRLRLLIELLRSQTDRLNNQVIATTHSPDILGWLTTMDLMTTFIATRKGEDGSSEIKSVGDLEPVRSVVNLHGSLPELFSEGWLETVA